MSNDTVTPTVPIERLADEMDRLTRQGVRLVRCAPDLLDHWGSRTERGEKISVEWGESDEYCIWDPIFTVHSDDVLANSAQPASTQEVTLLLAQREQERRDYADLTQEVERLIAEFEWMARVRHNDAHNGDIYRGGEFPCDLCPASLVAFLEARTPR